MTGPASLGGGPVTPAVAGVPRWISVDVRTGAPLADLPSLIVSDVSVTLSTVETTTAVLPLGSMQGDWFTATEPGRAALLMLEDIPGVDQPVVTWGGIIWQAPLEAASSSVTLSVSTGESALDHIYVEDETFVGIGQMEIARRLVQKYAAAPNDGRRGIPIRVVKSGGLNGTLRSLQYKSEDMTTLLGALDDLAAQENPLEFTCGWEFIEATETYGMVLTLGEKAAAPIGTPADDEGLTGGTFQYPGNLTNAVLDRDWTTGHGSNWLRAVSNGKSNDADAEAPESAPVTINDGRPSWMFKFTATGLVTNMGQLNALAAQAASVIGQGTNALSLTARPDLEPYLGKDWAPGDDVRYVIQNCLAFPGGFSGIARAIGYHRTLGVSPSIDVTIEGESIDAFVAGEVIPEPLWDGSIGDPADLGVQPVFLGVKLATYRYADPDHSWHAFTLTRFYSVFRWPDEHIPSGGSQYFSDPFVHGTFASLEQQPASRAYPNAHYPQYRNTMFPIYSGNALWPPDGDMETTGQGIPQRLSFYTTPNSSGRPYMDDEPELAGLVFELVNVSGYIPKDSADLSWRRYDIFYTNADETKVIRWQFDESLAGFGFPAVMKPHCDPGTFYYLIGRPHVSGANDSFRPLFGDTEYALCNGGVITGDGTFETAGTGLPSWPLADFPQVGVESFSQSVLRSIPDPTQDGN